MAEHHHSDKPYYVVYGILLVLTVVTVGAAYVDLGPFNVVAALGIASLKAGLVALWFMHLKEEDELTWAYAIYPIGLLVLLLAVSMIDDILRAASFVTAATP